MLNADLIASLPDDPNEAFVIYEEALRAERERKSSVENWVAETDYIASINAMAHYYDFDDIARATDNYMNNLDEPDSDAYYNSAVSSIMRFRTRAHFAAAMALKARRKSFPMDAETRQKIHTYVAHIRSELNKIEMPDAKREAIFAALTRFEMEIDTNRTSFESVADVAIRLADIANYWKDAVNPVQGVWEKALRLIEAMRKTDNQQLPPPEAQARLEDRSSEKNDCDDEIPF